MHVYSGILKRRRRRQRRRRTASAPAAQWARGGGSPTPISGRAAAAAKGGPGVDNSEQLFTVSLPTSSTRPGYCGPLFSSLEFNRSLLEG